jgi:biopolymer transport protein ExbB
MRFWELTWEFLQAGGPVMLPLLLLSLWLWALILFKMRWLAAISHPVPLSRALVCLKQKNPPPPGADPRSQALRCFFQKRCGELLVDLRLWEVEIRKQVPELERYVPCILVLAAAAPLLGLLGTVTGMIGTFDVIRVFGTGNARAMAAGISEALITTQSGLLVALPGLVFGFVLRRRIKKEALSLKRFGQGVARWLRTEEEASPCCR